MQMIKFWGRRAKSLSSSEQPSATHTEPHEPYPLFSVPHKTYFKPALASCVGDLSSDVTVKLRDSNSDVHSKTSSVDLILRHLHCTFVSSY